MLPEIPLLEQGRVRKPCSEPVDTAVHTIFKCSFWNHARAQIVLSMSRISRPEDVADLFCTPFGEELPEDAVQRRRILEATNLRKKHFNEMVEEIMGRKEVLERERQKVVRDRINP